MKLAAVLATGLLACESAGPGPVGIHSVEPSSWELSAVPDAVTVEGEGFQVLVITNLGHSPSVRVRHQFTGTLGGLPLDIELVANGTLEFPPPADLGSGQHELIIITPDGRTARAADAVTVGAGLDLPELVVTGSGDDNDIPPGVTNPTEDDAGDEVSLREAILIANGATEPFAIRFEEDVVITVDPNEALPPITGDGTVLDGSGADVVITGDGATDFHGLVIEANDVTVAGIRVEDFNGDDNHCLVLRSGDNFHLLDCTFSGCDGMDANYGGQASLEGGTGAVVRSCLFLDGERDGLRLEPGCSGALIEQNRMIGAGDDGLSVLGPDHVVRDNITRDNGGSGIEVYGVSAIGLLIEHNQLLHNGWVRPTPADNGAGVMVKRGATDVRIEDNVFDDNLEDAVQIWSNDTTGITVSRATFSASQSRAIFLREGANGGILSPTIDRFVGLEVDGFAIGDDGATVELYTVAANGDATYAVSTTTSSGAWSATLPAAAPTVAATLTIDGSTSELSAITSP